MVGCGNAIDPEVRGDAIDAKLRQDIVAEIFAERIFLRIVFFDKNSPRVQKV
ncbi:MAG: hypothetical protein ABSC55_29255 [Syntrophorhabdales bacterium]